MGPVTIHVITFALVAISLALIFQVRKQFDDISRGMQHEIDQLKGQLNQK